MQVQRKKKRRFLLKKETQFSSKMRGLESKPISPLYSLHPIRKLQWLSWWLGNFLVIVSPCREIPRNDFEYATTASIQNLSTTSFVYLLTIRHLDVQTWSRTAQNLRRNCSETFIRNFVKLSQFVQILKGVHTDSGVEDREYGRGDPLRWPSDTLYPQKLALTSPTRGGRSVDIVHSRTKATEFSSVHKERQYGRIRKMYLCNRVVEAHRFVRRWGSQIL
jgi:hypothetical protein